MTAASWYTPDLPVLDVHELPPDRVDAQIRAYLADAPMDAGDRTGFDTADLLRYGHLSPDVAGLCAQRGPLTRHLVANPHCPPELLPILADRHPNLRHMAIANPAFPVQILTDIILTGTPLPVGGGRGWDSQMAALEHPDLPAEALRRLYDLADRHDPAIILRFAQHPNTPADVLDRLTTHQSTTTWRSPVVALSARLHANGTADDPDQLMSVVVAPDYDDTGEAFAAAVGPGVLHTPALVQTLAWHRGLSASTQRVLVTGARTFRRDDITLGSTLLRAPHLPLDYRVAALTDTLAHRAPATLLASTAATTPESAYAHLAQATGDRTLAALACSEVLYGTGDPLGALERARAAAAGLDGQERSAVLALVSHHYCADAADLANLARDVRTARHLPSAPARRRARRTSPASGRVPATLPGRGR